MSECVVKILDEVNVKLQGLDENTRKQIVDACSFYIPKHFFHPKVQLGRWDGKISLAKISGYTYLQLMELWQPIIAENGYDISIEDERNSYDFNIELPDAEYLSDYKTAYDEPYIIRYYQLEAIHKAMTETKGVLSLCTGSGKTLVCAVLAKVYEKHGKVLVIVPSIDLIFQTTAYFRTLGLDPGMWYGELKEFKNVIVSTWQSLENTPELFNEVICFIVDESHGASAATLHKLLTGPGANVPFRFGCTGTPPDTPLSKFQIQASIGPIIYTKTTHELQQEEVLASSKINILKFQDDKNYEYQIADYEDWLGEVTWMAKNKTRMKTVGEYIKKIASTGNTLVLTHYLVMGKALEEELGITFFNKDVKPEIRQERYKEVNSQSNQIVLASMGVASTGIDIPRLENIVTICAGASSTRIPQSIGRGLRKAKKTDTLDEKASLTVWDISSDAGFEANHLKSRITVYNKAKHPYEIIAVDY